MGKGLEETLGDLQRQFLSHGPTFVIINDYKEEKQVEKKIIKT